MEPLIEKKYFLSANDANAEGRLSVTTLISNIIDIATEHANSLGIGNPSMVDMNAGWVLSRLTIDMKEYPSVNTDYVLKTWIEDFNRHFSTRCFSISSAEGKIYGYCRTIWFVIDAINHTNLGLSHFYLPGELILGEGVPIERQQKHFPIFKPGEEPTTVQKGLTTTHKPYLYTFKYCDLDFYRHVNTVKYVVLLMNQFSLQEHDERIIGRMELSFLHEAVYGMETVLLRADSSQNPYLSSFQLSDEAGEALLFARITRILPKS